MPKQLTLNDTVECREVNPFPGDAVDPDEVDYERAVLESDDGDVKLIVRAKGREVEYLDRYARYKVRLERVEEG